MGRVVASNQSESKMTDNLPVFNLTIDESGKWQCECAMFDVTTTDHDPHKALQDCIDAVALEQ